MLRLAWPLAEAASETLGVLEMRGTNDPRLNPSFRHALIEDRSLTGINLNASHPVPPSIPVHCSPLLAFGFYCSTPPCTEDGIIPPFPNTRSSETNLKLNEGTKMIKHQNQSTLTGLIYLRVPSRPSTSLDTLISSLMETKLSSRTSSQAAQKDCYYFCTISNLTLPPSTSFWASSPLSQPCCDTV